MWTNLKSIVLRRRSQIQKTIDFIIPFIWNSRKYKTIVTEQRSVVSRGWRWGLEIAKEQEGTFQGGGNVCIRTVVVIALLCTFLFSILRTIYFELTLDLQKSCINGTEFPYPFNPGSPNVNSTHNHVTIMKTRKLILIQCN